MDIILIVAAIAFGLAADWKYFQALKTPGNAAPNRWSWLIWSLSAVVEVATFKGISDDWLKVIPLATTPIACFVILRKVWQMKEDRWESDLDKFVDVFSVVASVGAIAIWVFFHEEFWAHIVAILAVPVSYLPQWKTVLKEASKPGDELPWKLWATMDALNLALNFHRLETLAEIPYVLTELACHASVWFLLLYRRPSIEKKGGKE
jgi:hypothetical protein